MKRFLTVGEEVSLKMPWSEVCMAMGIADEEFTVEVMELGAQLLNGDGSPFSFPITWSEAGIYTDMETGKPYVRGDFVQR